MKDESSVSTFGIGFRKFRNFFENFKDLIRDEIISEYALKMLSTLSNSFNF